MVDYPVDSEKDGSEPVSMTTKKQKHLENAERLYVELQLTLREIAAQMPVSYSTLREWKREGGWDSKRNALVLAAGAFHRELYEVGRLIGKRIREDLEAGETVSPSRYYALSRIMDNVNKTHRYEGKIRETEAEKKKAGKAFTLKDIIAKLEEDLF